MRMFDDLVNTNSETFTYLVIPVLIFFARICDQSIGTLRLIFVSKGYKYIAPFLGFFEVIIWVLAISQIMQHLDNVYCYIAYGAGFATGNYVGMYLEEKISLGTVILRIIPKKDTSELVNYLRLNNYGLTIVDAEGSTGPVKIIFSIVKRKDVPHIVNIINQFNPNAFYTIEEVKAVNKGIFKDKRNNRRFLNGLMKAK
jgi:uncharacterized protein YebE (UPF0316 family)